MILYQEVEVVWFEGLLSFPKDLLGDKIDYALKHPIWGTKYQAIQNITQHKELSGIQIILDVCEEISHDL